MIRAESRKIEKENVIITFHVMKIMKNRMTCFQGVNEYGIKGKKNKKTVELWEKKYLRFKRLYVDIFYVVNYYKLFSDLI
jgi:hypothetical protein